MSKEYYKQDLCNSDGNCKLYNPLQTNGQCVYYNEWCELKDKVADLEAKLAEKEDRISRLQFEVQQALSNSLGNVIKELWEFDKQAKISFCIEQLEKVKSFSISSENNGWCETHKDWLDIVEFIDNQIKAIKEME